MRPKLMAFDLDGTLLTNEKKLSVANKNALEEMTKQGIIVALASGRLGTSMDQYSKDLSFKLAMLTLNGAAVYKKGLDKETLVYDAPLDWTYAKELIEFSKGKSFAVNFYIDNKLYCLGNEEANQWIDYYHEQTNTPYELVDNLNKFEGQSPSKLIFVGDENTLDKIQDDFRAKWKDRVYVCRTCPNYLEFLNMNANKANGITAMAKAFDIDLADVITFGDAENDIPMLEISGTGIAMKNASPEVKKHADHVSEWTNEEDGIAREWERIKSLIK